MSGIRAESDCGGSDAQRCAQDATRRDSSSPSGRSRLEERRRAAQPLTRDGQPDAAPASARGVGVEGSRESTVQYSMSKEGGGS